MYYPLLSLSTQIYYWLDAQIRSGEKTWCVQCSAHSRTKRTFAWARKWGSSVGGCQMVKSHILWKFTGNSWMGFLME